MPYEVLENQLVILISTGDVRDEVDECVPVWAPGMGIDPARVIDIVWPAVASIGCRTMLDLKSVEDVLGE